ncbi:hypothetical protein WME91_15950 [Sorangium sp. So ce269]
MDWHALLPSIRNDAVQFGTMSPPGSPFATLERRVFITQPKEAVRLSETGDPAVLDALLPLLRDRDRAFAAAAVLAAMTRNEEQQMDVYATDPDAWWNALGKGAFDRWDAWLGEHRGKLVWDPSEKYFRATP